MSLYSTDFEGSTDPATFFDTSAGGWVGNYSTDASHFAGTGTSPDQAHVYGNCNNGYCFTGVSAGDFGTFSHSSVGGLYFRCYLYVDGARTPTGGPIITFRESLSGFMSALSMGSDYTLSGSYDDGHGSTHSEGGASSAFPLNAWHLVEIHAVWATDSSGTFEVKVDGSVSPYGFTWSGQTGKATASTLVQLQNPSPSYQIVFFDNVKVNAAADGAPGEFPCGQGGYWGILG